MEIKDYLHLYLNSGIGCFVFTDESITDGFLDKYIKEYPSGVYAPVLNFDNYHRFLKDGYKPILRRLSSMTEEEAIELFKKVSLFDLSGCVFYFHNDETNTWINAELNGRVIASIQFIGDNIEMMNNDGSFSAVNPVSMVMLFYLIKGFDLFGLIDAGLAIDKETLTHA